MQLLLFFRCSCVQIMAAILLVQQQQIHLLTLAVTIWNQDITCSSSLQLHSVVVVLIAGKDWTGTRTPILLIRLEASGQKMT